MKTRHGRVGLFYQNSLPIKIRNDLSFEESIVVELNFGRRKKYLEYYIEFLHLIIPLLNSWISCPVLQIYIPKAKTKIHMHPFFTGDFNGHSQFGMW